MSDDSKAARGKRGGIFGTMVKAVMLLGIGGAGVFGLMASGFIDNGAAAAKNSEPKLVLKGEEDPYAPEGEGGEEGTPIVHGEGGNKYRTAYFSFEDEFTSNLKDSDALVQLSLSVSTRRDGRVLMWLREHQLAIRSRILVELANTSEEGIYSPAGKQQLQERLTKAVNDVLVEREGFGGVDHVYFRTLIVQ